VGIPKSCFEFLFIIITGKFNIADGKTEKLGIPTGRGYRIGHFVSSVTRYIVGDTDSNRKLLKGKEGKTVFTLAAKSANKIGKSGHIFS
jgi:hypothetical protein